jgi:hypothetical protein
MTYFTEVEKNPKIHMEAQEILAKAILRQKTMLEV